MFVWSVLFFFFFFLYIMGCTVMSFEFLHTVLLCEAGSELFA